MKHEVDISFYDFDHREVFCMTVEHPPKTEYYLVNHKTADKTRYIVHLLLNGSFEARQAGE